MTAASVSRPLACGFLCALALFAWQALTVRANYGGNWTALYCTGEDIAHAPLLAEERVYIFRNSTGYDGQFYHLIAHNPLPRADLFPYFDSPRLRYGRILVPALVWLAARGKREWIDPAYRLVLLAFAFLGAFAMSQFAVLRGRSPWWGLAFLAIPSTLISADRLTLDLAFAALCAAFALAVENGSTRWTLVILTFAPLCRETGLFLTFAYAAVRALDRDWRRAAWAGLSAAPFLAWTVYLRAHTPSYHYVTSYVPATALVRALISPQSYAEFSLPLQLFDALALIGLLLACASAFWSARRDWRNPIVLSATLFAIAALVIQRFDMYTHVFTYGRVYAPLFLLVFLHGLAARRPLDLAPTWLALPRVAAQLAPQAIGIAAVFLR